MFPSLYWRTCFCCRYRILTVSWRRSLSNRNQSIDLQKNRALRHERVKKSQSFTETSKLFAQSSRICLDMVFTSIRVKKDASKTPSQANRNHAMELSRTGHIVLQLCWKVVTTTTPRRHAVSASLKFALIDKILKMIRI